MGECGGGRWSIVSGSTSLPQLASMKSATACCASWETKTVWRSGTADAVGRGPRVSLARGRGRTEEEQFKVKYHGENVTRLQ